MKYFHPRIAFVVLCLSVGLMTFGGSFPLLSQGPGEGKEAPPPNTGEPTPEDTPGIPGGLVPEDETPGRVGEVDELTIALANGLVDNLKALLASGTDPNHIVSFGGKAQVPILSSVVSSSRIVDTTYSLAKVLIEAGANVNLPDSRGWTPLHWATIDAPDSIVTLLLDSGADPHIQSIKGKTPYEMALAFGNRAAVAAIEQHSNYRHPQRDELFIRGRAAKLEAENSRKEGQRGKP